MLKLHAQKEAEVVYFLRQKWSIGQILRQTGVHKGTISRIRRDHGFEFSEKKQRAGRKGIPTAAFAKAKQAEESRPTGLCSCGCGEQPAIVRADDPKQGLLKGEYRKWVAGHYGKFVQACKGPNHSSQVVRLKQINAVRAEMVAVFYQDRFVTRDDVLDRFQNRGFDRPNLSRIFINGLIDHSRRLNPDELGVPVRRPTKNPKTFEPYERKEIPYEAATDISYLTKRRHVICLDAEFGDGGQQGHEYVPSINATPLETMMLNEEFEEREELARRRDEFSRFEKMNTPLVKFADRLGTAGR